MRSSGNPYRRRVWVYRAISVCIGLSLLIGLDVLVGRFLGLELDNVSYIRGREFQTTSEAIAAGEPTLGLATSPYFADFPAVDYFREDYQDPGSLYIDHPRYFWHIQANVDIRCHVPYANRELAELLSYRIRTNNRGFRNEDFTDLKEADEFRIVCMGDSRTFGWGVSEEDTFWYRLRHQLTIPERRVTTIAAAVPGYSSYQGLQLFRDEVLDWQPDVLVLWYGCNDSWPCRATDAELAVRDESHGDLRRFLWKSSLYRFMVRATFFLHESRSRLSAASLHNRRCPPGDFISNYMQMIKAAMDRRMGVIIISLGEGPEYRSAIDTITRLGPATLLDAERLFLKTQRQMRNGMIYGDDYRAWREKLGARLLDRYPALDLFVDPAHPNHIGHDTLARSLAEKIRELQIDRSSVQEGD